MEAKRTREGQSFDAEIGFRRPQSAMPGRGGLVRIKAAFWNTVGGIKEGLRTEAAIKQEVAIACIAFPLSFFIARDLWTWVALIASLLLVLSIEFLNTAVERLCNHIQPERCYPYHQRPRLSRRVLCPSSRRSGMDRRGCCAICAVRWP